MWREILLPAPFFLVKNLLWPKVWFGSFFVNFVIRMPVMPLALVRACAGLSNTSLAVGTVKS